MCYASKIILNDELGIKSNNSKFYDLLRKNKKSRKETCQMVCISQASFS